MVYTNRHPLSVVKRGVEYRLDTYAYNTSTRDGRTVLAGLKGNELDIPGRTGVPYYAGRRRDAGAIYLTGWVRARNVDDVLPDSVSAYEQLRQNLDFLWWLFDTSQEQIEFREYLRPVGSSTVGAPYLRSNCEVTGQIKPNLSELSVAKFSVELSINSGYKESSEVVQYTGPTGSAALTTQQVPDLAGSSAPIEDAVLLVSGPINGPTITDPVTGHRLSYAGSLTQDQQWRVDCANFTSTVGQGLSLGTASGTSVMAATRASGSWDPNLFVIMPAAPDQPPSVRLSGSGSGPTTSLSLMSRRKYL